MIIKGGYDGKQTTIRVGTGDHEGKAEVWIEMYNGYRDSALMGVDSGMDETLHYADITELIALRDEVNKAIKELAGV